MLKDLIAESVDVHVCGTCMARCGIYRNRPYFEGAKKSGIQTLADFAVECDRVLMF